MGRLGGLRPFPICPACDAHGLKAVIFCLKPQHPTLRLFRRCRWQVDGQRNILVHEGLLFSEPRNNAWT
jgi:hypothetical protein